MSYIGECVLAHKDCWLNILKVTGCQNEFVAILTFVLQFRSSIYVDTLARLGRFFLGLKPNLLNRLWWLAWAFTHLPRQQTVCDEVVAIENYSKCFWLVSLKSSKKPKDGTPQVRDESTLIWNSPVSFSSHFFFLFFWFHYGLHYGAFIEAIAQRWNEIPRSVLRKPINDRHMLLKGL